MATSGQFYPYQYYLTPDPTMFFRVNMERFIPAMYRTGEFEGAANFLTTVAAPLLDEMYQRYIELPMLADIDRCPSKFLQLLAGNINVLTVEDTFDETQLVSFRRRELGKMVDVFKIRGVEASFLRILKYLGSDDYGLIIPRKNLMILDITPISGSPPDEVNDVQEKLAPQYFDISSLADGGYDSLGNLVGSRISYALPILVIRSDVKLFWNDHEVPLQHEHTDGLLERSYFFNRSNSTITTNFVPLIGDKVVVEVIGDPRYLQTYRMADRFYWRPGTEEVYSDQNPLLRVVALEDRRPIGTLLYFAWIIKFFWSKCFPFPPVIDSHRNGYEPLLPPHLALTWNWLMDCNSPDPWFFQISNGYGYEAFWEARSNYQISRQLPFEASMREYAPKSLALNQEAGQQQGSLRLGHCQKVIFNGIALRAEITHHTGGIIADSQLILEVDAGGTAHLTFLGPSPEHDYNNAVLNHYRFSVWTDPLTFPTGGDPYTETTPWVQPQCLSIYFTFVISTAIPLTPGPVTIPWTYSPGDEVILIAMALVSYFHPSGVGWDGASAAYSSKYSGPSTRNSDSACHFEITKWVEGNVVGFTRPMPATTMPWTYVNGGLNNGFQYPGAQDGTGPIIAEASDGLDFTPGRSLRFAYVDGLVRHDNAGFAHDANGEGADLNPSFFDPATFPIKSMMLVGAFTDGTGQIIGQAFGIGNGPVFRTIPNGATQVQLGMYLAFSGSLGSMTVEISGTPPFTPGPPVSPPIYGMHRRLFKFQQRQEP